MAGGGARGADAELHRELGGDARVGVVRVPGVDLAGGGVDLPAVAFFRDGREMNRQALSLLVTGVVRASLLVFRREGNSVNPDYNMISLFSC